MFFVRSRADLPDYETPTPQKQQSGACRCGACRRSRGGMLAFKARRLLYHSTLDSRVIKKKEKKGRRLGSSSRSAFAAPLSSEEGKPYHFYLRAKALTVITVPYSLNSGILTHVPPKSSRTEPPRAHPDSQAPIHQKQQRAAW